MIPVIRVRHGTNLVTGIKFRIWYEIEAHACDAMAILV